MPKRLSSRFNKNKPPKLDTISIAVVSGGEGIINDDDPLLEDLITPTMLTTSFRSTSQIQKYLHQWRERVRVAVQADEHDVVPYCNRLISGHGFEGIPPETLVFPSATAAQCAVVLRIEAILRKIQF